MLIAHTQVIDWLEYTGTLKCQREKEMHTGVYTCTAIYRSRDTQSHTHTKAHARTHIYWGCSHTHTHTHTHMQSKIPDSKQEKRGKHWNTLITAGITLKPYQKHVCVNTVGGYEEKILRTKGMRKWYICGMRVCKYCWRLWTQEVEYKRDKKLIRVTLAK